jgi:hypothetical protein
MSDFCKNIEKESPEDLAERLRPHHRQRLRARLRASRIAAGNTKLAELVATLAAATEAFEAFTNSEIARYKRQSETHPAVQARKIAGQLLDAYEEKLDAAAGFAWDQGPGLEPTLQETRSRHSRRLRRLRAGEPFLLALLMQVDACQQSCIAVQRDYRDKGCLSADGSREYAAMNMASMRLSEYESELNWAQRAKR